MSNNNKFCEPLSYYVDFIYYFLSLNFSDDAKIPKTNIELSQKWTIIGFQHDSLYG